ncbi:MAG TPA: DUF4239 domain-containing protein [Edaphobacter sp.]|uniref:bestrophin-like domain n=1 Tax=Edaphobacter sp. TaxID=1934404 RepID=UPI002CFD75F0|nr:DUF4239 domain-containing protein [Edaphobacter sp.]HUZ94838.1 DUF4239 domain-containing protein [Edaphobacter sp.]
MLSYGQSTFAIVFALLGAMILVAIINRLWPVSSRKSLNDVNAWQMGVLGTTYGVILGFMLFTVWTDFRTAEIDVAQETAALLNVHRVAAGLPSPQREQMNALAIKYADAVINQEWPAMQTQRVSHAGDAVLEQMWQVLIGAQAQNIRETTTLDHLTTAMTGLGERRRLRDEEHESRLPGVLWVLLIVGGMATVVSSCLLGNDKKWLHYGQVLALTFVVSLTLATIADLARPFEGAVSVSPASLQRAMVIMQTDTPH